MRGSLVRADPRSFGVQIFDAPSDSSDGVYVRFVFEDQSAGTTLIPEGAGDARYSWFVGNDPARWVHGVPSHATLRWRDVYPGVDFVLHSEQGALEFELELAPGADLEAVRVRCEGVERVEIDLQGALVLTTEKGCLTQEEPTSLELRQDGRRVPIASRYRLLDAHAFGFAADGCDPSSGLWIDPPLQWSTYLGGGASTQGGIDTGFSVCLDRHDDVYICGKASGLSFPATPGAYHHPSGGGNDCYATKFEGDSGALVFCSVFGGSDIQEQAQAVRVDAQGRVFVAGYTFSPNFPTTPGAYDPTFQSLSDAAFVLQLSPQGDQLLWSTFLQTVPWQGGLFLNDMALDPSGAPVVVGYTSPGFPTTPGSFDPTYNGADDAFVTKLDPTGSFLEWSTFLGGNFPDVPMAVDIDAQGFVTVGGQTQSIDFPTTPGAYATIYPGEITNPNLFVTRFTPDGSAIVWSTFLGGGQGGLGYDVLGGLALLPDGGVVIAGETSSLYWPLTPGAVGTQPTGGFVARFDPSGSDLLYSTYLGTPLSPIAVATANNVTVDASGVATVVARAAAIATTPGAFDVTYGHTGYDTFLARLNPTGTKVYYGTYLGGNGDETPHGIVTTREGRLTDVGETNSTDFPTTPGAHAPTSNGGFDAFLTTFRAYLQGVEPFGQGTPTCKGPLVANATEMPQAGAPGFGFYLSGAPSSSRGICLVATAGASAGVPFHDAMLWLDPAAIFTRIPIRTNELGFAETGFPLAGFGAGTQFFAQYFVRATPDCPGGGLGASGALRLTVQ